MRLVAPRPDGTIAVVGRGAQTPDLPEAGREVAWGTLGGDDLVVVIFNPNDQEIRWRAFLGGGGNDLGLDLQVEADGTLTVAGYATEGFLVTEDASQRAYGGGERDGFVVRINPDAKEDEDALLWATFIGGPGDDGVIGAHVDAAGAIIAAGYTSWVGLPTTADAIQPEYGGNSFDAFVLRIDPGTGQVLYGTYFGGAGSEGHHGDLASRQLGWDTALTDDGSLVVVGHTSRDDIPFTQDAQDAFDRSANGFYDVFICRLDPKGEGFRLGYSTLLGGSAFDAPTSVSTTMDGSIVLTGLTWSENFPTSEGAFQRFQGGSTDAFVVKLDPTRAGEEQLMYSSYIGGAGSDGSQGVVAFEDGLVAVAVNAICPGLPRAGCGGGTDGYVAVFDLQETSQTFGAVSFSRYFGGSRGDWITEITASPPGDSVLLCGGTDSSEFPVTPGALQETIGTPRDGFFGKMEICLEKRFLRGDCNADGTVDISDAISNLFFQFMGSPITCGDAADVDDNGHNEVTDVIYLLTHLYLEGPAPTEPYPICGPDPTLDDLTCESFEGCQE